MDRTSSRNLLWKPLFSVTSFPVYSSRSSQNHSPISFFLIQLIFHWLLLNMTKSPPLPIYLSFVSFSLYLWFPFRVSFSLYINISTYLTSVAGLLGTGVAAWPACVVGVKPLVTTGGGLELSFLEETEFLLLVCDSSKGSLLVQLVSWVLLESLRCLLEAGGASLSYEESFSLSASSFFDTWVLSGNFVAFSSSSSSSSSSS